MRACKSFGPVPGRFLFFGGVSPVVFFKISSPLEKVSTSPGENRAWPNLKSCLNPSCVRISSGYVREPFCWELRLASQRRGSWSGRPVFGPKSALTVAVSIAGVEPGMVVMCWPGEGRIISLPVRVGSSPPCLVSIVAVLDATGSLYDGLLRLFRLLLLFLPPKRFLM